MIYKRTIAIILAVLMAFTYVYPGSTMTVYAGEDAILEDDGVVSEEESAFEALTESADTDFAEEYEEKIDEAEDVLNESTDDTAESDIYDLEGAGEEDYSEDDTTLEVDEEDYLDESATEEGADESETGAFGSADDSEVSAVSVTDDSEASAVSETASGTCGTDLTWVLEDGVLTISGSGNMSTYSSYSSVPWYDYVDEITEVVIESGVTSIGSRAFYKCASLSSIEISDSVTSIGSYVFYYCSSLSSIDIPDGVTSIGSYAFSNCSSLSNIDIPDSVTTIGNSAFRNCSGLSSVDISDGVTSIGSYVFYNCSGLSSIIIPDGVTSIGSYAFYNCTNLAEVWFDGDAPASFADYVFRYSLMILYHSSKDGWDDAMEEWSVVDGTEWIDIDTMISSEDFVMTETSLNLEVGDTHLLETNADNYLVKSLIWSSSDSAVAYIVQTGNVTALNAGSAVITVQTEDGSYKATCTVNVTADTSTLGDTVTIPSDSEITVTDNVSDNNYSVYYASNVLSYLYENEDGSFTRVEYTSSGVVVETYSEALEFTGGTTIDNALSLWGGFYSGGEYNFLVFGQSNSDEDDSVEVLQVLKYSKDWELIDKCSIYGANTYVPFRAGSLRMTETAGLLYIYTCHTMYASSDGVNHQANMTFVINESDMSVEDQYYSIMNNSYGYVSHSFNQFIQTDGEYIYRVDHGDAHPRGIYLSKVAVGSSITNVSYTTVYTILGTTGANATGVSIGGFELSSDNCLIVGNSVDMSDSDNYSSSGTRNIFISVTDQNLGSSSTIWLTDYDSSDGVTVRTPQLVKVSSDVFLMMWEESADTVTTKMVLIDGSGNLISEIEGLDVRLSDCQPIVTEDGLVTWYVTDGSKLRFYQISPYRLSEIEVNKESLESATVTLSSTSYTYSGSAKKPTPTVTMDDGTVLTKGTDYTVTYSDNVDVGTATVTITGTGFYEGTLYATFTINAKSISSATVTLAETSYTYDGSAKEPEVSSVVVSSTTLTQDVDYTVSYSNNTDKGTGKVTITGIGNYTDTRTKTFTISAQTLLEENGSLEYTSAEYTGSNIKPSVTVLNEAGDTLVSGTDYSVTYSNNKNLGTASVVVTGKNNYTGSITLTFEIVAQELSSSNVSLSYTSTTYTGSELTPSVTVKNASGTTLTKNTHYTVAYSDNTDAGTAAVTVTGTGNYTGTVTVTFTITSKSLSSATVTLSTSNYTYDGSEKKPAVTVKLSSTTLTDGTDYTVSYSNNVSAGTATVTITGTGNYTGTAAKTFTINTRITELYGDTRYETMTEIAEETFDEGCTWAVIASGLNFPDALSASALAGVLDAPIILVSDKTISDAITTMEGLGITNAYIVGGTSAVSSSIESAVEAEGISVERLWGRTRQDTAVEIANEVLKLTEDNASDTCIVAAGASFADALSGSPYAYWSKSPIYLANNNGSVSDEVVEAISAGGYKNIIVLGGTAAVTADAYVKLAGITGVSVIRIGGETRYETSALVAEWSVQQGMVYDGLAVASGTDFPDALAGAALCGRNGSVILLSNTTVAKSSVLISELEENADQISSIYILGGTAAISSSIRAEIKSTLN